jgi:SAM-dependent methyltransferase
MNATSIDETNLQEFMGRAVGDIGAAMSAALVLIGDRLGLYKAMAEHGAMTPAELAGRTKTQERYVREWLNNQAAGGYVAYDAATKKYVLPAEQAMALADETSPAFIGGAFKIIAAVNKAVDRMEENFRTGKGLDWCDQAHDLFEGTERFFRPNYAGNLVSNWIPALTGVEHKLKAGCQAADIGCGLGASTILMAQAFPRSRFWRFDFHPASIEMARKRAAAAGVADRVTFATARSTDYPVPAGKPFDFVACFDCLHDMGDPAGAAGHVRRTLAPDGVWMIVEPFAGDAPEQNLNPVGRVFYAASTMICVPASLAHNGPALGAQAGEQKLKEIILAGGFTQFRRATQTPFNLVLEARP